MRKFTIIAVVLAIFASPMFAAVSVTGKGRAPGGKNTSQAQALADALRDAVRKGAGVDLLRTSKVTNFMLDYDRVFSSAFGYVRNYKIISSGLDEVGDYVVEVRATVEKGTPGMEETLALRTLIRLKGSPRIYIRTKEKIGGVSITGSLSEGLLKELARKMELEIVRGNKDGCDFIIEANVTGDYLGKRKLGDVSGPAFSIGCDIEGYRPDKDETIISVNIPSIDVINFSVTSPEQAARKSIQRIFEADPRLMRLTKNKSALTVFRRLISNWVTELDLGTRIMLKFKNIDHASYLDIQNKLRDTNGIAQVWGRSFSRDPATPSLIEVEARLIADQLAETVITLGKFDVLENSKNYVTFKMRPEKSGIWSKVTGNGSTSSSVNSDDKTISTGMWIIIGISAIIVLSLIVGFIILLAILLSRKK